MPLTITRFRLAALVGEVLAELEPLIAQSDLAVATALDRAAAARPDATAQKVKQIVLNLLTNAVKFTPHGRGDGRRRCRASTRRGSPIAVADTGIGIAPGDQESIFEDFQQADNSPTRDATAAPASAWRSAAAWRSCSTAASTLESKLGEGSTFTLVLPSRRRKR